MEILEGLAAGIPVAIAVTVGLVRMGNKQSENAEAIPAQLIIDLLTEVRSLTETVKGLVVLMEHGHCPRNTK